MESKKVIYIDMDGVVADFEAAVRKLAPEMDWQAAGNHDAVEAVCIVNPRIFLDLPVIQDAIMGVDWLGAYYDVYFLSTPMECIPESWTDKKRWINQHFGHMASKRLILTHRKDLQKGFALIDDRKANGVDKFGGFHIHFGQPGCKNWIELIQHFILLHS